MMLYNMFSTGLTWNGDDEDIVTMCWRGELTGLMTWVALRHQVQ
jgi:hypothetical protein